MLPNLKRGGVIVNEFRMMRPENADPLREGPRVRINEPQGKGVPLNLSPDGDVRAFVATFSRDSGYTVWKQTID